MWNYEEFFLFLDFLNNCDVILKDEFSDFVIYWCYEIDFDKIDINIDMFFKLN